MGTRKATFLKVKVYVAGLYLQQKSTDPTAIVKSPETKRLVLEFTRNVDKDQMVKAVNNGIKKSTDKNIDQLRPQIAQVVRIASRTVQRARHTDLHGEQRALRRGSGERRLPRQRLREATSRRHSGPCGWGAIPPTTT